MSGPLRRIQAPDVAALALAAAAVALVVLPASSPLKSVLFEAAPDSPADRVALLSKGALFAAGRTAAVCLTIGVLASALALVWAWWLRSLAFEPNPRRDKWGGNGAWAMAAGLMPLLLPSYLAYAGWNLIRSPGSWLGDALAVGPVWVGIAAWMAIAIIGMCLWVWPVALLVLAPAAARIPDELLDAMHLDGAGRFRRARECLWMLRWDLLRAIALCAVVMAGSAIPLHVAQVYTYSIWLWGEMNRVPDMRGVWIASWPVLLIALAGAALMLRCAGGTHETHDVLPAPLASRHRRHSSARLAGFAALAVWAVSIPIPLALFLFTIREPAALIEFWRDAGPAMLNSAKVAAAVGIVTSAVLLLAWLAASAHRAPRRSPSTTLLAAGAFLLVFIGLVPGVLVGAAFGSAWPTDSSAVVVAAHVARFGFVGVLLGLWLAAAEPASLHMLRALDGASSLRGWLAACVSGKWGVVLGGGLAAAMLSFHEIESTVQVQPPGPQPLAQYLLEQLHYLRQDQLAAAGATLTGLGLIGALAGALLLAKGLAPGSERS